ncbi:MAG: Gfo/Idh/MocA family oxidoreductase, partial [Ignavibacteria bacterium]|nr:Gfo/Idh/MocA family oxidoreductase [Ignavibacteria bacterium]
EGGTTIRIYPLRGAAKDIKVWTGEGGHGGGDVLMLDDVFSSTKKNDKYLRAADQRAGAYSILTGVAANLSMAQGKEIIIAELVKNIGRPEFPTMPKHTDPIEMPPK